MIVLRWSRRQKLSLSHLIEAKPRGSHRFITKVTNQISIQYSHMQDFLIKRCDLAPPAGPGPLSNMFSMRRGQAQCKARGETLYLSFGAGWRYRATDRLKRKGTDLRRVSVTAHIGRKTLENVKSSVNLEVSETIDDC